MVECSTPVGSGIHLSQGLGSGKGHLCVVFSLPVPFLIIAARALYDLLDEHLQHPIAIYCISPESHHTLIRFPVVYPVVYIVEDCILTAT